MSRIHGIVLCVGAWCVACVGAPLPKAPLATSVAKIGASDTVVADQRCTDASPPAPEGTQVRVEYHSHCQPLFVVDGSPLLDNSDLRDSARDACPRASDVNPDDIVSVSILKSPASVAIFGPAAKWGAVLITTGHPERYRCS